MEPSPTLKRSRRRGYAPKLGWYLSRLWLKSTGFTLLGLGAFIYLLTISDLLRQLSGVAMPTVMLLAWLKIPDLLLQLLPFAMLVGSLVWLNNLNRHQELVAIRASGLPARRFLAAPVFLCWLVATILVGIGNPIATSLLKRYDVIHAELTPESVRSTLTNGGNIWLKQDTPTRRIFIYGQHMQAGGSELASTTVFIFDRQNMFEARLDAQNAKLTTSTTGNSWIFSHASVIKPDGSLLQEQRVSLPTKLTPAELASSLNPPATLNAWELWRYRQVLGKSGLPTGAHTMALANIVALPVLCVVMMLLAIPFGLRFARNRGLVGSIGAGVAMGFVFYVLRNVASAYGIAGRLDPILAAAIPIAIGSLMALAMILYLQEE
jgi:lipopolysaccharide export system permease protein